MENHDSKFCDISNRCWTIPMTGKYNNKSSCFRSSLRWNEGKECVKRNEAMAFIEKLKIEAFLAAMDV